ncbi:hypothetical protein QPL77_12910 [Bacillus pumilus]|uniref:hypothetical protein n=2 Tax=Bacillus TaxID=1386 RepID=UPI00254131DC|nr:hypothetical protein [Bacillus pumilus]WIG30901.1 hypothetical protein QPL77_12910 [Bacillus pumilus]
MMLEQIFNQINIQNFIVSILTSGIVTLLFQSFVKGGINNYFNKKMVKFKDDIAQLSEERKLDFDRRIHDFSLYSTKRHELYPELFKQVYRTSKSILNLEGMSHLSRTFIRSKSEIIPYYESIHFQFDEDLRNEITLILEMWNSNVDECLEQISSIVKKNLCSKISLELKEANEFFEQNILFFSDTAVNKLELLMPALSLLFMQKSGESSGIRLDEEKVQNDIDSLEELLKSELSKGDYSK